MKIYAKNITSELLEKVALTNDPNIIKEFIYGIDYMSGINTLDPIIKAKLLGLIVLLSKLLK